MHDQIVLFLRIALSDDHSFAMIMNFFSEMMENMVMSHRNFRHEVLGLL